MENGNCFREKHIWIPDLYLSAETTPPTTKYGVMILNRPLTINPNLLLALWNGAAIRQTVDGGCNRWMQFLDLHPEIAITAKAPDIVSGDFDSIRDDVMECVKKLGCRIVHTPDQNETDFTKALRLLDDVPLEDLVVIVETSGRMDQIMACINTLYHADKIQPGLRVFLMSSNAISWLMFSGQHSIQIPARLWAAKRWCSLIPTGCGVDVTTKGLKWDLRNSHLEFGKGIVSTSNTYGQQHDAIEIETNGYFLWSMGTRCDNNIVTDKK